MERDYRGKVVYVGIDVHKKSYTVYCVCDREKVKSWNMKASPELLIEQLKRYFPKGEIHTAYEAGFSGNALHRKLKAAGINSIVVNPGSIETASRDKVKTDKRDAKKLSEQLSDGRLSCIYIPTEEEELRRLLPRLRATLVGDRTRIACRIKSKLSQFGYDTLDDDAEEASDKKTSSKWINELLQNTSYPAALKRVLDHFCRDWLRLTKEIIQLNKDIAQQSKENDELAALESIYRSAPGIGLISARELSRELGTLSQFSSNKRAYSYLGLTPSESSSGERRRQGGISHCGRPRLRHLLTEISWRSVAKDAELATKFAELSYRRGKKRAIVAIARILIGRLRHCLMNGVFYQQRELTHSA
jgi:transposase